MAAVTLHGKSRIKNRLHIRQPKRIKKHVDKVFNKGIKHYQVEGNIKRYMDALYFKYRTANNIRLYKNNTYIFAGRKLITVFSTPRIFVERDGNGD